MVAADPWFWTLIGAGAALVAVAVVLYARGRRPHRDTSGTIGEHEFLVYLNETTVMDILQYRGDVPALKRLVEQYTRESAEGRGEVKTHWFGLGGSRTRDGETTESYEAEERPITAIRTVVRALEAADAIVYADFHTGEVHAHRSLADGAAGHAKLSDTRMFLSVDGLFEGYEEGDGSDEDYLRLRAPYPSGEAHVRVKVARSGVRERNVLPDNDVSFRARVLGKVENWDAKDGVLKMWALAIFR
ncbi:hypothetical protein [Umezawaea beigongshangensis]|uniref:hypothetical protein n=1 Tax=Umezawaea beigongshangensis TaxID=2780383 RepID=UPI0018F15BAF|nr:hypothetical protein [Umezawaea beigongshangensis]